MKLRVFVLGARPLGVPIVAAGTMDLTRTRPEQVCD